MYIVEWLKDGEQVHRKAMLGANTEDILAVAKAEVSKIIAATGSRPNTIRVQDALRDTTIIEKIDA